MNLTPYINWLKNKNLAPTTISLYQRVIKKYGAKLTTTKTIQNLFTKNLTKYQASYLILQQEIFKSYTSWQKVKVNWERITRIIPSHQKRFFNTINPEELTQLKLARVEKNEQVYQRNNLILDLLFYSGIRVNELIKLKHSDYANNSLRILGKGNKERYTFISPWLIKEFQPNITLQKIHVHFCQNKKNLDNEQNP